ncbi:hypothetical protein HY839_01535 [Candidatus Azambacteria bacterium]|nr:hypothetical protein [Candidatus Azambacteria bacterium]
MEGMEGVAVTVISIGGNEHFGICFAKERLDAASIKVVRDTRFTLIRDKQPDAREELRVAVEKSVKASRAIAVVIASYRKESISGKAREEEIRRAIETVRSWKLPVKKIFGICFNGRGDEKQIMISTL